jgi:predicted nucleic acid-binding protein
VSASGHATVSDLLVDSDILIDVSRNVGEAIDYLQQKSEGFTLVISSITQMELLVGCRNKAEQQQLERFLRPFPILPLNEAITDEAVDLLRQYRLSHGLLIPDALIAATARVNDTPLATRNQRDYRFIAGLQLLPYP